MHRNPSSDLCLKFAETRLVIGDSNLNPQLRFTEYAMLNGAATYVSRSVIVYLE
jgi:hypothetical protein